MNLWLPGVKGYLGVWDGHVHTAIFKMDKQQGTTSSQRYSIGNSADTMWQPGWEGNFRENGYIYLYS